MGLRSLFLLHMSMPSSNKPESQPRGLARAKREKWTNWQWMRYRLTGYTPEDMVASDNGILGDLEQKVFRSQMEGHRRYMKTRSDSDLSSEQRALPSKDIYFRELSQILQLAETLKNLDSNKILANLEKQYELLLRFDEYCMTNLGRLPYLDEPELQQLSERVSRLPDILTSAIDRHLTSTPLIVARTLRNLYYAEYVFNQLVSESFLTVSCRLVQDSQTKVIGLCLEDDDYPSSLMMLGCLEPRTIRGESFDGLPYYYDLVNQDYVPDWVVPRYYIDLLGPLMKVTERIISKTGIENAQMYRTFQLISGLVKSIKNSEQLLRENDEIGEVLQMYADSIISAIHEATVDEYGVDAISDNTWCDCLRMLTELYDNSSPIRLDVPKELCEDWVVKVIQKKRQHTKAQALKFADKAGIELPGFT